ncbi:hypothetical protein [Leifsonia shinshuensis]
MPLLLAATVVSGLAGYVVTWRVFVEAGAAGYGVFSVFWSALFLVVGVLFGVQQEATRAVAQTDPRSLADPRTPGPRTSLATFAPALAVVVVLVVLATSPLWAPSGLGPANAGLAWFVAVGAGFNCLVAAASGILAGAGLWRQLAAIISLDGILRVVFVLVALAAGGPLWLLALAVILPFPLSLLAVVASAPRRILGRVTVSESFGSLAANTGRTMLAASATAVLINGFPLVLSFFATGSGHAGLGSLVLAVTLTRAPILVPLTALSSFLVSRFTHHPEQVARTLTAIMAGIAALAAVMCLCAYLFGLPVMKAVFGPQFDLAPGALTALVGSAALIGALSVSGAAVLARGKHGMYAAGWVAASVITLALLFLPLPLAPRAALALAAGPAVGVAIHLFALRAGARDRSGALSAVPTEGDPR